jgi:short-subunit dehydrogenase
MASTRRFSEQYGRTGVVLGASEGLGAAFASALADRGLPLLLVARRPDALEAVAEPLRRKVAVRTVALDLGSPEAADAMAVIARDEEVGLVVHNAAFAPIGPFLGRPLADAHRALDVNLRSLVTAAHVFGRPMAARGRGGLIVMSSLTAMSGSPRLATYGATKAFGLSFAEALWHELGESGVDVMACCAGATSTPGFLKASGPNGPRSMTPGAVVEETLAALGRGPSLVPGALNRLAAFALGRLMPRRAVIAVLGREAARLTS